jgi:hypothetical protein
MNKSNTKSKPASSKMVQPLSKEDGSVMEEYISDPPRTQANFDTLFDGMPSLDEILTKDEGETGNEVRELETTSRNSRPVSDDSWFDDEKRHIQEDYQQILEDMQSQIDQQRRADPDEVPSNAADVVESVVAQEMERKIASIKTTRAKERLQDYEISKLSGLNSRDLTDTKDVLVERLLKDAADDWKRRDARQAKMDDFLLYERDAFQSTSNDNVPQPGSDLDVWALERLEDMLKSSAKRSDDEGGISDILVENIEDLRGRIERESKKGSVEPQTMKEWQMYRAIATRLSKERGDLERGDAILNQGLMEKPMSSLWIRHRSVPLWRADY